MSFGTATLIGADLANLMVGEGLSASDDSSPKELIVELSDDVSETALEDIRTQYGMTVAKGADTSFQLWTGMDDPIAAAQAIATVAGVEFLDLNVQIGGNLGAIESVAPAVIEEPAVVDGADGAAPASDPGIARSSNDPSLGSLWGLGKIDAQQAWDTTTGSSEVIIGVIDTGIDVDHADLNDNIWVNTGEIWGDGIDNDGNGYVDDYNGYDFYNDQGIGPGYSRDDDHGHGTHVAGTIAAEGNNGIGVSGVAWEASMMALKFLGSSGYGSTYDATRAVRYATANGAHLTNNSWGGGGYSSSLYSAINEARAAGVLFVAAAGNSNRNTDIYSNYPSNYNLSNVISVASTTSSDGRSSFSNYGASTVDLGAPGSSIYSTYRGGGYATLSGTSMATPHVAGAIALMLSKNPDLTMSEVTTALFQSGDSISSLSGITVTGKRLNVNNALALVQDADTPISDLSLSASSFAENAAGVTIGTITPTGGAGAITYSIAADPSSLFTIRNGNQLGLRDGISVDHETVSSVSVTLQGRDSENNTYQEAFTLSVSDVNEAPTGISGSLLSSVAENAAVGTVLGTMTVTGDPDDGDSHTFSLLDDHGGLFSITADTGVLSVSGTLNFTTQDQHNLTIRATDSGGLFIDRAMQLDVLDVSFPPELVERSIHIMSGDTVSSQLNVIDLDGDTVTATLSDGPDHGTLSLQSDGSFTYDGDDGFTGVDTFSVVLNDGKGGVQTETVTVDSAETRNFSGVADPLTPTGGLFQANTESSGSQIEPDVVALSDGRFFYVWRYNGEPDLAQGQFYTADGQPSGGVIALSNPNAFYTTDVFSPVAEELADGSIVVSWGGGGLRTNFGAHISADGNHISSPYTGVSNPGRVKKIIAEEDGGFTMIGSSQWSVSVVRAIGGGSSTHHYTVTTGDTEWASGDVLANGDFLATYISYSRDGPPSGSDKVYRLYVRQIDMSQNPPAARGAPVLVREDRIPWAAQYEDLTARGLEQVEVAVLEGGSYVLAWRVRDFTKAFGTDPNRENLSEYVEAQIFNANGTAQTGVFQASNIVNGGPVHFGDRHYITDMSVVATPEGGFVISWDNSESVFAQRYDSSGQTVGAPTELYDSGAIYDQANHALSVNQNNTVAFVAGRKPDDRDAHDIIGGIFDAGEANEGTVVMLGGDHADLMIADDEGRRVDGQGGDDRLYGGTGDDRLIGGAGNDTAEGGLGADILTGGDDNDVLSGGDGDDNLAGDAGDDALAGDAGNDTLSGGDGADTLSGGDGNDYLSGDDGNDALSGNAGADTLIGGVGADTLSGGDGADSLVGGDGADMLQGDAGNDILLGDADGDTLMGGDGNDTITGGQGADALYGGDGNDILNADTDDTVLSGGDGNDLLQMSIASGTVTVSDGTLTTGGTDAAFSGIETVDFDTSQAPGGLEAGDGHSVPTGSGVIRGTSGADRLIGTTGNDEIVGDDGADVISGGAGDDVIHGEFGNDTLIGGAGDDTLVGGNGEDVIYAGTGNDTVDGGVGYDTLDLGYLTNGFSIDLENSVITGADIGTITYHSIENIIYRNARVSDSLSDPIVLTPSASADTFIDTNAAIIDYSASSEGVTIDLSSGVAEGGLAEGDLVVGANRLVLSDHRDEVTSGIANETIEGGGGTDIVRFAGNLADYVVTAASGTVTVTDSVSDRDGTDRLTNVEVLSFSDTAVALGDGAAILTSNGSVSENGTVGDVAGSVTLVTTSDESFSLSLSDDANGLFTFDAVTGQISTTQALDHEAADSHTVTILAAGNQGTNVSETVTISVLDVNETPVDLGPGSFSVLESVSIGQAIGTFSADDPDDGDTLTYELIDADGTFVIGSTTGILHLGASLDFETAPTHTATVRATDSGGLFVDRTIQVDVLDVNEAPEISDLSVILSEANSFTWTAAATDDDGDSLTYSLDSAPSSGTASISSDGRVTYTPTGDLASGDSFGLLVTDEHGATTTSQIRVSLSNGELGVTAEGSEIAVQSSDLVFGSGGSNAIAKLGGDKVASIWRDRLGHVYSKVFNADGTAASGTQTVVQTDNWKGDIHATEMVDGGAIIQWRSSDPDTGESIMEAQRIDSNGRSVGSAFEIARGTLNSWGSGAGLADGTYVVAYPAYTGEDTHYDIHTRRFAADGTPLGEAGIVNSTTTSEQRGPDIVGLADGGYAVVWESKHNGSSFNLRGRVFNADGTARTNEFGITSDSTGHMDTSVTQLESGALALVWFSGSGSRSAREEVRTARVSLDGLLMTAPTIVDTELSSSSGIGGQFDIEDLGNDHYAVSWYEYSSSFAGGFIQVIGPDGQPIGDILNVEADNRREYNVELAALDGGTFFAGWHHTASTGRSYLQRYSISTNQGFEGSSENDLLIAGDTGQELNGAEGDDLLRGGAGDDTLNGGVGSDALHGGAGTDSLNGDAGDDTLLGDSGEDILNGGGGSDTLDGGTGSDQLNGGAGDDTLLGNDGNDTLFGDAGSDALDGGVGDDTLTGGEDDDTLQGGEGNDTLTGGTGADSLSGGDGHDTFIADANDVFIDGGDGNDTLRIDGSAGGTLSIDLSNGTYGSGTISSIENVLIETGVSSSASGASSNEAAASTKGGSAASLQSEDAASTSSTSDDVDLIVDLSKAVSLETIASAKNLLGAETVRSIDGKIEFWDILDDTVDVGKVISDLGLGDAVDLNESIDMSASLAVDVTPIEIAEATYDVTPDATVPNDPNFGILYGMDDINATQAWDIRNDASSIVVGVIDTGIDVNHPDLVNNLWVNEGEIWGDGIDNDGNGYVDDYHGYDFYNNAGIGPGYARDDDHSHGTHVAGTIAAEGNNGIGVSGVAWQAQLMAVKIFSGSGTTNTTAIVEGIRYATMMGAKVTNNSWGGGGYSSSILSAITDAQSAGSIFVAAAGNNYGNNNDANRYYPSGYNLDNIVAVASTDSADRLSSFSNYGATTVDLGAPGSGIYSTTPNGSYGYKSGTSMATPHVAGALALVMAENPSLSYSEAISVVLDSTEALSSLSGRTLTGGRLDLHAALESIANTPPILSTTDVVIDSTRADSFLLIQTVSASYNGTVDFSLSGLDHGSVNLVNAGQNARHLYYTAGDGDYSDVVTVTATGGDDTVSENVTITTTSGAMVGTARDTRFFGGDGANTITTGTGNDYVHADDGDDLVYYGGGSDTLVGGNGNDTLSFAQAADSGSGFTASLQNPVVGQVTQYQFENLEGGANADRLTGDSGDNMLSGGGGSDTLTGGDGADSLIGGAGTDYAAYTDAGGVTVSLSDDRRSGSAIGDTFDSIEGLIGTGGSDLLVGDTGANSLFGAGGADTLIGGDGADFLSGDAGNDLIIGGDGNDTLHGGTGDDFIFSGTGNDVVNGGTGTDTLHLGYVTGALNIDFDAGTASGADIGTVTFQNVEFLTYNSATGGAIAATSAQETFADTGTLTLSYAASDAGVTLDLDAGAGTGGFAEGDSLYGVSSVAGSGHDDRFVSGSANETIDGGAGNDAVVYEGNIGEYALSIDNGTISVADSVAGRDGTDSVVNAEALVFADGTLSPNEGVSILMSGGSFAENAAAGAAVGTITAFTLTGETFSLSLTDGASGAIDFDPATGVLTTTRSFDFETEPSASIVVTASGDQGTTVTQTLALTVSDVNEAPVDIGTAAFTVAEDAGTGDAVGTIDVNDPDAGDSHTFTLTNNAGGLFSIDQSTGVIRVAGALDHETAGVHTLTVQGTDSGGLSNAWPVTVTVGDVNEAPTITPAPMSVGEHSPIGATVGTFTATDQDDGDSVTFSLTDNADGRFTIDSSTGVVRLATSLDYENAQSHTISARATDSAGLTDDTTLTIQVTDENDAPIAQPDAALAQEEQALTLSQAALLGNDSDPDGDTLTISTVGNAQNGTVSLDGNGDIVFTPNDETIGAASFDYTIIDGRGGSDTATVSLTIEAQPQDVTGGDTDDEMTGGSEADQLSGGAGADTLMGRKGDDVLMGGTGDDVYVFRAGDGADTLNEYAEEMVTGTRQVSYNYTTTHRRYVSSGESGYWQTYSVSRTGTRDESYQYAQQTDAGNDTLRFGTGISLTDLSATVDGNDLILQVGGAGGAGVAAAGDSLRLTNWFNEQERIENFAFEDNADQTLTATDILSRFGTDGADTITWTESAVSLDGAAGDDVLTVGDFDDTLTGGAGNDVLNGGGGTDEAVYSGRLEDYTIDLSQAQAGTFGITDNRGTDGTDTLIGIETLRFSDGTLGLTGDNIAPFARGDTATTDEDVALTLGLADVSANDISLDGDALAITAVDGATGGSVALNGAGDIVFTPDANYNGAASFTYTVADPAGATSSATVAVTVNAVNDAPGLSADGASGHEDTALTIALSDLLSNDSDIDGDALTVTAVNGASNGTVALDGQGNAVFTPDADFAGAASFSYTASDGQGGTGTQTVSLNITNTNDAPVDASFSGSDVSEAASIGTAVGTVGVTDVDSGDSHTFSLTDTAGDRFSINAATGVVSVAGALNFEGAQGHTITVQVTDSAGANYTEAFSIGVTDANEAPVMSAIGPFSMSENAATGSVLGTVSASDVDAGDNLTYSLTDNANGLFGIDSSTGQITLSGALDYETATSHTIGVQVSDAGGLSVSNTATVSVIDGNDAPVTGESSLIIRAGASSAFAATANDPNSDSLTFSAASADSGSASITSDGTVSYTAGSAAGADSITFTATDTGGLSADGTVNVNVIGSGADLTGTTGDDIIVGGTGSDRVVFTGNQSDYQITQAGNALLVADGQAGRDGKDTVSAAEELVFADSTLAVDGGVILLADGLGVAENTANGGDVGAVSLLNFTGSALTLSLLDDAGGRFNIDGQTGSLTVAGALDHESAGSHTVTIGILDGDGAEVARRAVDIAVNDVNEAPVDLSATSFAVNEDATVGDAVGTVTVNDPDDGDSHSLTLTNDAGGLFTINAATGVISVAGALDHENAGTHTLTVQGTDAGGLSNSWPVTVTVGDVNEAPVSISADMTAGILESAANGSVVGTISASDLDAGDSVTFSLTDDAGGLFTIDGASGEITLNGALDRETAASHVLGVRATDSSGLSLDGTATVAVGDVDEAPITAADTLSTSEETDLLIDVSQLLSNDADPEGGALTLVSVGNAQNGNVSIGSGGLVQFRPDAVFTGTASFDYTVRDAGGNQTTESVTVDVTELQRQLIGGETDDVLNGGSGDDTMEGGAGNDTLYGRRGTDNLAGGIGNDLYRFQRGDGSDTINETTMETLTGSRQVAYTYVAQERYLVSSGESSRWATRNVTRTGYRAESYEYQAQAEGGSDRIHFGLGIAASDLVARFDGNDLVLTVSSAGSGAASGDEIRISDWTNSLSRIEEITFEGDGGTTLSVGDMVGLTTTDGDDSITWTDTAATINGDAGNDSITTGAFDDVLTGGAGDDQLDGGDGFDAAVFSGTLENYRLNFLSDSQLTVADLTGTDGTDTLTNMDELRFSDGTLALAGGNIATFVRNDTFSVNEDSVTTLSAADLTGNDLSLDGDPIILTGVSNAVNGAVSLVGGNIVFAPTADFSGTAGFDYTVSDGRGGLSTGRATVNVAAVDDASTGLTLSGGSVAENLAAGSIVGTVTAQDPDAGDSHSYTLLNHTDLFAVDSSTGLITTLASMNHEDAAQYTLTVRATGQDGLAAEHSVTVAVADVNEAPNSIALSGMTVAENSGTGTAVGTASVSDVDAGDTHSYTLTDDANGLFTVDAATGVIRVAGALDREVSGSHTVTIQATDEGGLTTQQAATITVSDVDEAPITSVDTGTTQEDTAVTLSASALLSNDSDPESGALHIAAIVAVVGGAAVVSSGGDIIFTPDVDYNGDASVEYQVSDAGGNLTTSRVDVSVAAVNDAPDAGSDTASTAENEAVQISTAALLANDSDVEGDSISVTAVSNGVGGTAVLDTLTQIVTFTPTNGFVGDATFDYTVTDANGDSSNATVTVSIGAVDQTLTGSADADILTGASGNDTLYGLAGADTLSGGRGTDALEGGAGNDLYQFNLGDGSDTIVDHATTEETTTRTVSYSYQVARRVSFGEQSRIVYETRYGTRQETVTQTVDTDAGADALVFGTGIGEADLAFSMDGNDLVVNVTGTASDSVRMTEWNDTNRRIEEIRFTDSGTVLDAAAIDARVTQGAANALKLASAMATSGGNSDGDGSTSVVEEDNNLFGQLAGSAG